MSTARSTAGATAERKKAAKKPRERPTAAAAKEPKPAEARAPLGRRLLPWGLAVFGGLVAWLGFAGMDVWPLAFVAFVPFFAAIDLSPVQTGRRAFLIAWLYGFVGICGGYYWLVEMLEKFSGFPMILNIGIASIFFVYLGLQFALIGWLWHRGKSRGWNGTLVAVAAFAAVEQLFVNLFPFYYGTSFHVVPVLMQIADLGGPILLTILAAVVSSAIYEIGRAVAAKRPIPRKEPIVAVALVAATVVYGLVRMSQVDAAVADAEKIDVGVVQVNMGIFSKREDPWEGQRRHIEQTLELEREHSPDLVIWPESAYTFFLPEGVTNVRRHVSGPVKSPLLFGGLARREVDGEERHYNTAYIVDENGDVQGTYDKTYLLAFGEYIPFGDVFPSLYEMSPNTGRFTPGDHVRPVPFRDYRISVLVCYEDIIPAFVRGAVREADPHLLVNVTNDAWFGDTTEPWIHLALAKFRAIEHRRFLVRSTNSGVSAIVDPAGRVVTHSGVFTRENLHASVAMMKQWTPYQTLGSWPGWLGVLVIAALAFFVRPGALARFRKKAGAAADTDRPRP